MISRDSVGSCEVPLLVSPGALVLLRSVSKVAALHVCGQVLLGRGAAPCPQQPLLYSLSDVLTWQQKCSKRAKAEGCTASYRLLLRLSEVAKHQFCCILPLCYVCRLTH